MAGKKPPAPPQKPTFREDPGFAQAVQNYEAAVKAMQEHKFERAKSLLEKILAAGNRELMDRARVHLNLCNQQLAGAATTFSSVRFAGSIVVSLSCDGGISPRPLKRLTSTFAPALNSRRVFASRSASSIA